MSRLLKKLLVLIFQTVYAIPIPKILFCFKTKIFLLTLRCVQNISSLIRGHYLFLSDKTVNEIIWG